MLHLLIITHIPFFEIFQHADKDLIHIFMYQFAVRGREYVICTPLFMQSQREGPVLVFIPKREFHLVPVSKLFWAGLHAFKDIIPSHRLIHNTPYLPFLHLHLFFIRHGLVHTSPTFREDTADRLAGFLRRPFQDFKKPSLRISTLELIDHKADLLPGDAIFYCNIFIFHWNIYNSFIWEIHSFNNPFKNLPFFHRLLQIVRIFSPTGSDPS